MDRDTIWVRINETGAVAEVGRSSGNSMISCGHAVQVSPPAPPRHAADGDDDTEEADHG